MVKNNPCVKSRSNDLSFCGSRTDSNIEYKYDDDAKGMVPFFGKPFNRYDMIQAAKASVDINDIVQRAKTGDVSVVNVKQVLPYTDVSQVPDNINDAHTLTTEALNSWSKLNPEVRSIFNNDLDSFMTASEDGSLRSKINDYYLNKDKVEAKDGDK